MYNERTNKLLYVNAAVDSVRNYARSKTFRRESRQASGTVLFHLQLQRLRFQYIDLFFLQCLKGAFMTFNTIRVSMIKHNVSSLTGRCTLIYFHSITQK
jgi:hypothetical protein